MNLFKLFFPAYYQELQQVTATLESVETLSKIQESQALFDNDIPTTDYAQRLQSYTDADRERDIQTVQTMFYNNSTYGAVCDNAVRYGLGRKVSVSGTDERTNSVINEVIDATRNLGAFSLSSLRQTGLNLINQAELFFVVWYDQHTRLSTVQRLDTTKLKIIWDDPTTKQTPQFFILSVGDNEVLYRDWRTSDKQVREFLNKNKNTYVFADALSKNNSLKHVAVWAVGENRHILSGRGVPLYLSTVKSCMYLSRFEDQRFAVAKESAKVTTVTQLQANPNSVSDFIDRKILNGVASGSEYVTNDQIVREWQENPTGITSERFNPYIWMQSITARTGQHAAMLGIPSMLSNRSVLVVLQGVFAEHVEAFQNSVADVYRTLFHVILLIYNNTKLLGTEEILSLPVQEFIINLDTPYIIDTAFGLELLKTALDDEDLRKDTDSNTQLLNILYQKLGVKVS